MARYNLVALRKEAQMSQKELADRLGISQGFLSNVENGRSPFPEERIEELQAIFPDIDISKYEITDEAKNTSIGSNNSNITINESRIMEQFGILLEKAISKDESGDITDERKRCARLSEELDESRSESERLRRENYALKEEIFRLKELLMRNHIEYSNPSENQ